MTESKADFTWDGWADQAAELVRINEIDQDLVTDEQLILVARGLEAAETDRDDAHEPFDALITVLAERFRSTVTLNEIAKEEAQFSGAEIRLNSPRTAVAIKKAYTAVLPRRTPRQARSKLQ